MKARDAANQVRKAGKALFAEIEDAEHRTLNLAWRKVLQQSSGMTSQGTLNKLNNPYGHGVAGPRGFRGAIPYGDAGMVNVQSGRFKAGWEPKFGYFVGGSMTNSLINETPEAEFMDGTRLMIRRPILDRVALAVEPVRLANLQEAFRRANQP